MSKFAHKFYSIFESLWERLLKFFSQKLVESLSISIFVLPTLAQIVRTGFFLLWYFLDLIHALIRHRAHEMLITVEILIDDIHATYCGYGSLCI